MEEKVTLQFCGGVGSVTGANFLLADTSTKVLIDCGLIQGRFDAEDPNELPFPYNPADITFLVVTHAHIDHIGRIGKLIKEGFRGVIYSTPATRDLAEHMLEDAVKVMGYQSSSNNKKEPLYTQEHVDGAFSLWKTVDYHQSHTIGSFSFFFKDAGHILGSTIVEVTHLATKKKIVFSGDLGNSPTPLLKDIETVTDADYVVMESVYGDRVHEAQADRKRKLQEVITKVVGRGGTLIVPVFSLEKTQIFLKEINDLIEDGHVPSVPVFFDSPLGIKITSVYAAYTHLFSDNVQKEIAEGDDIFDFPKLEMTMRQSDSRAIGKHDGAKIIVASSGMSEGGRITMHEKRYLPDPKNALLLIGYQVAGSLGRRLQDGVSPVRIDKTEVPVNAEIITITGYSAHADSNGLLDFVANTRDTVKKVFVVMGEPKASLYFVQKVRDTLSVKAEMPDENERVELT